MYCLSCRAPATLSGNVENFTSKNGRRMQRSMCDKCGKVTTTFSRKAVPSLPSTADAASDDGVKRDSLTESYETSSRGDGYDSLSSSTASAGSKRSSSAKKAKTAAAAQQ